METFTKGLARDVVDAQGENAALGAWGTLADRGHSLRPEHVHHLLLKAYTPNTAVPARSLETAIVAWEMDIRSFQDATGDKFPEANRKMDRLREYFRAYGKDRFPSYELIKSEVVDWLVDEARRGKTSGGRAAALGEKELEDTAEGEDVNWENVDEDNMTHGQLIAPVKNTKVKVQKGKGTGKGAPRACYECGAEDHIAAACPVRKEQVEAGGPERLPAGDVQMGGGKSKRQG